MRPLHMHLPMLVTVILSGAALWHGPIAQLPDYHDFADQTTGFGIPHFADVISNLGFALVALWGWWQLAPVCRHAGLKDGWAGYRLFLIGLFLTAIGSSYYHLAPDDASLVWDRLPIALACGGLLAGVRGDACKRRSDGLATLLAVFGIASVALLCCVQLDASCGLHNRRHDPPRQRRCLLHPEGVPAFAPPPLHGPGPPLRPAGRNE